MTVTVKPIEEVERELLNVLENIEYVVVEPNPQDFEIVDEITDEVDDDESVDDDGNEA